MSEPFLANAIIFAGSFAPRGWAFCEGQLFAISAFSSLYSILGTAYGGDGRTSFALPDLRGRSVLGTGPAPGRTARTIGEHGGEETVVLSVNEMPVHTHTATNKVSEGGSDITVSQPIVTVSANAENSQTTLASPTNNYWGAQNNFGSVKPYAATTETAMAPDAVTLSPITATLDTLSIDVTTAISETGGGQPHENMHPWLAMNYIIAVQGAFPARG